MKLLHLADLHFGKSVNKISMLDEQRVMCGKIVELAKEHEVDAVLIAGDVYDTRTPSDEAVELLDDFINRLAEAKKAVFLISGNHDSAEKMDFGRRFFQSHKVFFAGKYKGELKPVVLEDEHGPVNFYLLPFVRKSALDFYLKGEEERFATYDDGIRAALAGAPVAGERSVLLAHQFVTANGEAPQQAGSETNHVNIGTLDNISSACFDGFDYVALGHIHTGQQVGRESCRYGGTLLKYDLSEVDKPAKSVPLVTLGAKGEVSVELLPVSPVHEMLHLQDSFAQLVAGIDKLEDKEAYYYVTLTDDTPVPDAMNILQSKLPHIMKLDYQRERQSGAEQEGTGEVKKDRTFEEIMTDFYHLMEGKDAELSAEEWQILQETAKEAGVLA